MNSSCWQSKRWSQLVFSSRSVALKLLSNWHIFIIPQCEKKKKNRNHHRKFSYHYLEFIALHSLSIQYYAILLKKVYFFIQTWQHTSSSPVAHQCAALPPSKKKNCSQWLKIRNWTSKKKKTFFSPFPSPLIPSQKERIIHLTRCECEQACYHGVLL